MIKYLLPLVLLVAALAHAEQGSRIRTLPVPYPPHWVVVQDAGFFHMSAGKNIVLDVDAAALPAQFKGMMDSSFAGQFQVSTLRREFYIAESFHSRGQRGERTDVLTIYDQATLAPKGEVIMPGGKRFTGMPVRWEMQLLDGDRLALVFNLTPATSVSVVDVEKQLFLSEVATPGCAYIFPTGKRGFSSLCGDGAMLSMQLDPQGKVAAEKRLPPIWDIDADPLFEKAVMVGGIAFFPSFHGQMLEVNLRGKFAKPGKSWPLLNDADRTGGWRPGGLQMADSDREGRLYLLFHAKGAEGTHKNPGSEVWVYNARTQQRERRIVLHKPAVSITLTRDEDARMIATAEDMSLDVYEVASGKHLRTISGFGAETPFVVYAVN